MGFVHLVCTTFGKIMSAIGLSGICGPFLAVTLAGAVISLIYYIFWGVKDNG